MSRGIRVVVRKYPFLQEEVLGVVARIRRTCRTSDKGTSARTGKRRTKSSAAAAAILKNLMRANMAETLSRAGEARQPAGETGDGEGDEIRRATLLFGVRRQRVGRAVCGRLATPLSPVQHPACRGSKSRQISHGESGVAGVLIKPRTPLAAALQKGACPSGACGPPRPETGRQVGGAGKYPCGTGRDVSHFGHLKRGLR